MVRFRQLLDRTRHRLLAIPLLFVAAALVLSQTTLAIDRVLDQGTLPYPLRTTVEGGRAILTALAGGLITSVTLLLSAMLVAVQLAASQFSPRALRDWIGDRVQQGAIGMVLGTAIYCLLILRETRSFGEGPELVPDVSVLTALVLGVLSLVAVVRSVDHLTDRMRVGSVARHIMSDTIDIIERRAHVERSTNPTFQPSVRPLRVERRVDPPGEAVAIPAPCAGWVQQIDESRILNAVPQGTTVYLPAMLGSFIMPGAPLAWLWPGPGAERCDDVILSSIAVGDTRTMQEDVGFGILQLVDIALRALSPGVNDPNTANDIVVHLGAVMLALWEREASSGVHGVDGRTLLLADLDHADFLHAAFDQLRRYGAADPDVASTLIRTLGALRSETIRRALPGPLAPITEVIDQVLEATERSSMSDADKATLRVLGLRHSNGDASPLGDRDQ